MSRIIARGTASNILRVSIPDNTLTNATSGLRISSICDNESTAATYTGANIESVTTLGTYQAPSVSTRCRFRQVSATNHPFLYEIHLDNSRFSVSGARSMVLTISFGDSNIDEVVHYEIDLDSVGNIAEEVWDAKYTRIIASVEDKTGYSLSSTGMNSVTLPANIITATSIASNAITAAKIASSAITDAKIASNAITAAKIADGAITSSKLASATYGAISERIANDITDEVSYWDSASTFLASYVWVNASRTITGGTVSTVSDKTGYSLSSTGMNGVTLPANIITASSIASSAITAAKIASNAITDAKIASNALNGKGDWNIGKTGYSLTEAEREDISSQIAYDVDNGTLGWDDATARISVDVWTRSTRTITGGTITTNNDKTGYSLASTGMNGVTLPANIITASSIASSALNGKGDWNIGKTGYSLASTGMNGVTLPSGIITGASIASNAITSAKIAAAALNGKGDWNIGKTGYSLSSTGMNGVVLPAGIITASSIANDALDGKGDWLDIIDADSLTISAVAKINTNR